MDEDQLAALSELERDFRHELRGHGSLALHFAERPTSQDDERTYVGYDLHPENLEALFFDGIGIPRWETLNAESVEEKQAEYMERYNELMSEYPMISRSNDTHVRVIYGSDEVGALLAECDKVLEQTSDAKAVRAAQKLSLAASKAAEKQTGLEFIPRN